MKAKKNTEYKVYQNHWDGILFPVNGKKDKIIICMSGSEGGMEHAGKVARFLQDNGVPALALGYFKTKHTQKTLERIPLEIIQSVIRYLTAEGYEKIGIEGASKGAEYALAAAAEFSEISCVIVKTPSWFYSEGLKKGQPSGTSCWSFQGKELPFTPYEIRKFHMLKMLWKAKEYNLLDINTGKNVIPDSVIPVERIHAPILILSTEADTIWPSKESGEKIEARLRENHFSYPYRHICYEHMSHMMLEYCGSEIQYFIKSEKEYPTECTVERRRMGETCLDWIENIWQ